MPKIKPTGPGFSSFAEDEKKIEDYLQQNGSRLTRSNTFFDKVSPTLKKMKELAEGLKKFSSNGAEMLVALGSVKQMFEYPESVDATNLILCFEGYGEWHAKKWNEIQQLLLNDKKVEASVLSDEDGKRFPCFLYTGKTVEKNGVTVKDRTAKSIRMYPEGKTGIDDLGDELKDPLWFPDGEKGKAWWDKSIKVGKDLLADVYANMVRVKADQNGYNLMDKLLIYSIISVAVYHDYSAFDLLSGAKACEDKCNSVRKNPLVSTDNQIAELFKGRLGQYKSLADTDGADKFNKSGEFTGFLGSRILSMTTLENLQTLWKEKVNSTKTPVDEAIAEMGNENVKIHVPRYIIAKNEETKEILVAVRGTAGFGDVLADLKCDSMPSACGKGRCQMAMQLASIAISLDVYPQIKEFVNSGYTIVCAGHSLGAACSHLVAILLNTSFEDGGCNFGGKVQSWGYGCPPCITTNDPTNTTFLSDTDSYINTVVNQNDIIPRMSPHNVSAFIYGSNNSTSNKEVIEMMSLTKMIVTVPPQGEPKGMAAKAKAKAKAKARDAGRAAVKKVSDKADKLLMKSGNKEFGKLTFGNLWVPGTIYHISYTNALKPKKKPKVPPTPEMVNIFESHLKIKVEKTPDLCIHRVPRNHPRVCFFETKGTSFGINHKSGAYLTNLADIYWDIFQKVKPDEVRKPEGTGDGGCCTIC